MVLSLLTLLAFFHCGISSSIAMDDKLGQEPTPKKVVVHPQDELPQEEHLISAPQVSSSQTPNEQTSTLEVQLQSFLSDIVDRCLKLIGFDFNIDLSELDLTGTV